MSQPHSLFIFGLGYSSAGIARQAQHQGWVVTSTARKPARWQPLQSSTYSIVRFDPAGKHSLDEAGQEALQAAHYVVTSIPPVAARLYDPVLAAQHRALRQAVEAGCCAAGVGYLSSTGVYGNWDGDWVDESCEPRTATARGLLRLEAEQAWVQLAQQLQLPLTIFRLGGIYGPRRSVLDNLKSQGPSSPNAARRGRQRFTSRCHVADVAQAVLADMGRRTTQQQQQQHKGAGSGSTQPTAAVGSCPLIDVINVVDDEPAPRGVVEACAQQLLLRLDTQSTQVEVSSEPTQPVTPQQQQSQAQGQPRQGRRQQEPLEEKRVRNMKLLQLLRDQQQGQHAGLLAPTYREGLRMVLDSPGPFAAEDLDCLFAPLAPAAGK